MFTRRRFTFWVGFGLFSLSERLNLAGLDCLAAAAMGAGDEAAPAPAGASQLPMHWRAAENDGWRWYERETLIDGTWTISGVTTPISKTTGEEYDGKDGYLEENSVPATVRFGLPEPEAEEIAAAAEKYADHHPTEKRRSRHGRPPSKWLRSLKADELHIWLKTIEAPEATVSGMTFWEHLTRDHMFDPANIEGLDEADQAKLHAAAHFGY
jgi:hypothetical protein